MKLTLKRFELVNLFGILSEIVGNTSDTFDKRFIYAVYRNIEYFESEIKSIKETQKENLKFQEYQVKIQEIGKQYCDKDKDGNPVMDFINGNQIFKITERKEEANNKIKELQSEYKEVIEQQQKDIKEFEQLMNETIETDCCKISFNNFPNTYNINKHKVLKYLIKENDDELEKML